MLLLMMNAWSNCIDSNINERYAMLFGLFLSIQCDLSPTILLYDYRIVNTTDMIDLIWISILDYNCVYLFTDGLLVTRWAIEQGKKVLRIRTPNMQISSAYFLNI